MAGTAGKNITDASWSPDGTTIAYSGDGLHIIDLQHNRNIQIEVRPPICASGPEACQEITWQPKHLR